MNSAEPPEDLSRRQYDILYAVRRFTQESGRSPSMREVAEAVGLSSTGSLHYQYRALIDKGYLRRVNKQSRTAEVRLPGETAFPVRAVVPDQLPGDDAPEGDTDPGRTGRENVVLVAIAGRIRGGGPIRAEQEIEDYWPLPKDLVGRADGLFMLTVSGDSMIGVGIFDGDLVVIEPLYDPPQNGDIVAATIDNVEVEGTVKTYLKEGRHVWLMPQNPAYTPIPGGKAKFPGKVVAVLRQVRSGRATASPRRSLRG